MFDAPTQKTFWLINQYASTPETGMGGRHYYFAKELAKQGHKVYLIGAGFTHLLRQPPVLESDYTLQEITDNLVFVWVKMPEYNDAHDKQRVLNWVKFAWKLLKIPKVIIDKPDAILYSSPSLIPFLGAQRLSKKLNAKLIWDIRDIWPLTLTELGGLTKYHPFIVVHQLIEMFACRHSDFITSNWPYAIEHLSKYGAVKENFLWLPNGFDRDEFEQAEPLDNNTLNQIPRDKFIVGYTGTLGKANAIQLILDAALLTHGNNKIHYLLVGGGKLKNDIVSFIKEHQLDNVTLMNPIPKKQIPSMLAMFDVCYVGFNKSPLYKFGNSLNKLPEYLMSGKPILYSIDSTFKPVDDAQCGLTVPAENIKAIVDAILKLNAMSEKELYKMGQNGRAYANENHDYAKLTQKIERILS